MVLLKDLFEKSDFEEKNCRQQKSQSELTRPIKIGLGCVCGVELCTKLQHSVSRNSSKACVVSTFKINNSGDPKYSVSRSNNVYLFS